MPVGHPCVSRRGRRAAAAVVLAAGLLAFAAAGAAEKPSAPLPPPDAEGWIPLFNGKDLNGWDGDPAVWRVESGCIVGKAGKVGANTFLIGQRPFSNFILEAKCLLIKGGGFTKSAIQYRSRVIDPAKWIVGGYQAACGEEWWGTCFEERGRGVLWGARPDVKKAVKPFGEWNHYVIEANGATIKQTLNGALAGQLNDTDEKKRALEGIIALQYHAPGGFEVRFKDLRIKLMK